MNRVRRPYRWMVIVTAACTPHSTGDGTTTTDVLRTAVAPTEAIDVTRFSLIHAEEYAATRDQVWNALLAAQEDLAMPLQSADTAGGVVVYYVQANSPRIAGKPAWTWVDCGRGPGGAPRVDSYRLTFRLLAVVEPAGGDLMRVRTKLLAYARESGATGDALPCSSTGELEQRTLAIVAARVAP